MKTSQYIEILQKIVKRKPNTAVLDENKVVKIRKEFMNNATIKALSKNLKLVNVH